MGFSWVFFLLNLGFHWSCYCFSASFFHLFVFLAQGKLSVVFSPPGFFLFPMGVLGLSNPADPSPTSGSHGLRRPLPPSLALAFNLHPSKGE